jgi:hypothetical protein
MDFRHEYKFIISIPQSLILRERISAVMQRDVHGDAAGSYAIRSVYFDDCENSCYMQNEAGTDPRAKYRIRSYNASDGRIVLEKKIKQNGMTRKMQQNLSKEQYLLLMDTMRQAGGIDASFHGQPLLVQELLARKQMQLMQPKVIVAYERTPFIEPAGNVRVTFDDGISSSQDFEHFFSDRLHMRPVMPVGQTLMEVKFDEFLPAYIRETLEIGSLAQTTFSKYYLCRRYSL